MTHLKPILLVDDDGVDAMAVRRALKELDFANELVHVVNGEEALAHLRDKDHETPCAILLDLNMPKMNGLEFLEIRRTEAALKDIPVVVVTTSPDQRDVTRSLQLGAAAYIIKGADYREFRESIRSIARYVGAPRERLSLLSSDRQVR